MLLRRSVYLIPEGGKDYTYSLLHCVCVYVHMPQHACGGQRTSLAVHLHGLFCLSWGFLFAALQATLLGPQASGDSPVFPPILL